MRLGGQKQRIERLAMRFEHDVVAGDHVHTGPAVLVERRELLLIAAEMCRAIKLAAGIGLVRRETRIWLFGHFARD